MNQKTVQKSDFDQLSEYFAGLAGEYIKLQKKHNRLSNDFERVIEATRKTQYDQRTIQKFKQNLGGEFDEHS